MNHLMMQQVRKVMTRNMIMEQDLEQNLKTFHVFMTMLNKSNTQKQQYFLHSLFHLKNLKYFQVHFC